MKGKLLGIAALALAVGAWVHTYRYRPPTSAPLPVPDTKYQLDHLTPLGTKGIAYQQQPGGVWVITVEGQPCAQIDVVKEGVRVWFLAGWQRGQQYVEHTAIAAVDLAYDECARQEAHYAYQRNEPISLLQDQQKTTADFTAELGASNVARDTKKQLD